MAYTLGEKHESLTLFGGDKGWHADDWTASDDRVRGGKSQSYFKAHEKTGVFYGILDIKTLGGAGFASQRTTGEDRSWDLSDYAGVQLSAAKGDKKRYTLILKDTLLDKDPETGREQATISWECDFELPPQAEPGETLERQVYVPWSSLNPTYRGKLRKDAKPIDLKNVKRFSIMMRSFFGTQEGDFSITLKSIKALKKAPKPSEAYTVESDLSKVEAGLPAQPDSSSRLARAWSYTWRTSVLFLLSFCFAGVVVKHLVLPAYAWLSKAL